MTDENKIIVFGILNEQRHHEISLQDLQQLIGNKMTDREWKEIFSFINQQQYLEQISGVKINRHGIDYFQKLLKEKSEKNEKVKIEKEKLLNDAKLSKWQKKTFWWIFFFGLIGGICGIISLLSEFGFITLKR